MPIFIIYIVKLQAIAIFTIYTSTKTKNNTHLQCLSLFLWDTTLMNLLWGICLFLYFSKLFSKNAYFFKEFKFFLYTILLLGFLILMYVFT